MLQTHAFISHLYVSRDVVAGMKLLDIFMGIAAVDGHGQLVCGGRLRSLTLLIVPDICASFSSGELGEDASPRRQRMVCGSGLSVVMSPAVIPIPGSTVL